MKSAEYWECRNAIIEAHLSVPDRYDPFADLFDLEMLSDVRSRYAPDLYAQCYADTLNEVMNISNVVSHLRALGVQCKPVFTPDDCHFDFIAVFSLGLSSADRINKIATKSSLYVLFQCPTH